MTENPPMIHELSVQMPIYSGFPIAKPSDFGRFLEIDTGHAPRALGCPKKTAM